LSFGPATRPSRFIAEPLRAGQRRRFIRELREAKRKPLDPGESFLAEQVARRVGNLHDAGAAWHTALADIDATWPSLSYRVALTAIFWSQPFGQRRRRRKAVAP
jgi:hypothetical protein